MPHKLCPYLPAMVLVPIGLLRQLRPRGAPLGQRGWGRLSLGPLGESVDDVAPLRGLAASSEGSAPRLRGFCLCKRLQGSGATVAARGTSRSRGHLGLGALEARPHLPRAPQGTRGSASASAQAPPAPSEVPGGAPGLAGTDGQAADAPTGLRALSEADLQQGLVTAAPLPDSIPSAPSLWRRTRRRSRAARMLPRRPSPRGRSS